VSFSYQQQKRNLESFTYFIKLREKQDVENFEFESRKGFYSKGTLSNFWTSEFARFQAGYELSTIDGYANAVAGSFGGENIKRHLGSYDVFASSELTLNEKWSLRPGARAMFSSLFDTQIAASLSAKYAFENGLEARVIAGTSPRLPNYDELYTNFINVNHNFLETWI
jgi:outer membrane receptor for ferrienterochelin and colicins